MTSSLKLIAGLGNPGYEYATTRHNIGWMIIDHVARALNFGSPSHKFDGELFMRAFFDGEKVLLLKPHTWMNLSGKSVGEASHFYKIEPEDILIICDDVALPFAQLRVRAKGSAGGHNGLASVIGALGTLEVPRLRVGVGGKPEGGELRNWVLGHFSPAAELLDRAANAALIWAREGIDKAMNYANSRTEATLIKISS